MQPTIKQTFQIKQNKEYDEKQELLKTLPDDLNYYYHLRLTTHDDIAIITDLVVTLGATKYLISNEQTHYHCIIYTEMLQTHMRKILKKSNYSGNGNYSLAKVRNKEQMIKYALKDGKYNYKGFPDDLIESLKIQSHGKGKQQFAIELKLLEENYYNNNFTHEKFGIEFIKLKAKYNQNLYSNHIKAFLDMHRCKKEGTNFAYDYYNMLYRFN